MVKIIYKTPYNHIFKKEKERIKGNTLGEIIDRIINKYNIKSIEYAFVTYDYPGKETESLSARKDLDYQVKPKGTLSFTWYIGGG